MKYHFGPVHPPRRRRRLEDPIQIAVANYLRVKYPQIKSTIAPQGIKFSDNKLKNIIISKKMKDMGYEKGTPDLMIFKRFLSKEVIIVYSGLFIEIKSNEYGKNKGSLTKEQKDFINYLRQEGYYADVCYGAHEGYDLIDCYMSFDSEKIMSRKLNYKG
jgi:hypothetical protein